MCLFSAKLAGIHPSTFKKRIAASFKAGEHERIVHAHRLLRSYLIEASWQAIRSDPVMQGYYRKHQGKNTKKVIVKVARKLLSRTLAVIKTGTPYQIGVVE